MTQRRPLTLDDERHGSAAGAIAHRRQGIPICEACREGARLDGKRRQLWRDRGVARRVPIHPKVWEAVTEATSYRELSRRTGVSKETLRRIVQRGPRGLVNVETQAIILRFLAAGNHYLTPVGLQRRLEALGAVGWSMIELSARSSPHVSPTGLWRLRARTNPQYVFSWIAEAVARLYDEYAVTPAPAGRSATRTLQIAHDRGYRSALAWDEGTIDDPEAAPSGYVAGGAYIDEQAIYRRMHGDLVHLTRDEQIEVIRRCLAAGWTHNQIEEKAGLNATRSLDRAVDSVDKPVDKNEAA